MANFQVLDEFGNVIVSEADFLTKTYGSVTTVANQAGFVDVPVPSGSRISAFPCLVQFSTSNFIYPTVTVNGNRISWTAAPNVCNILIGSD